MKKSTKLLSLILCLIMVVSLTACAGGGNGNGFALYYVGTEDASLVQVKYTPKADLSNTEEVTKELLNVLQNTVSGARNCAAPISTAIELLGYKIEKDKLTLDFSQEYLKLDTYEEIAIRAAIVATLAQIDGVTSIFFTVNGQPLADSSNNPVGGMNGESFTDVSGSSLGTKIQKKVKLYYACDDGTKLATEEVNVEYLNTASLERVVVERLIKGPEDKSLTTIIPKGTKLLNLTVKEGVCYISFDNTFLQGASMVDPEVTIYGIVNSLAELSTVNKVQFSIESDSNIKFMEDISLNQVFSRNLDLVRMR